MNMAKVELHPDILRPYMLEVSDHEYNQTRVNAWYRISGVRKDKRGVCEERLCKPPIVLLCIKELATQRTKMKDKMWWADANNVQVSNGTNAHWHDV